MASLNSPQNLHRITSLEKGSWTSRTYREAVLNQIQTVVAYDAYCFTTVDPATLLSTGAVTEDGIEAIHDQLFFNEYMEEDLHKYADLIQSGQYAAILHASVQSRPDISSRYTHILLPAGFGDELRTVFVNNNACWGYLTLYRKQDKPAFSEEERLLVQHWTSSIAFMLRTTRLMLMEELKGGSPREPGIVLLQASLEPVMQNAAARYWLSELRRLEQVEAAVLPRPVRAVSSHLLQSIAMKTASEMPASEGTLSKVCVQLTDGRYVMLQASVMEQMEYSERNELAGKAFHIAVWLEQAMPQDLLPLLSESYALSARERELLGYVLRSFSSKEIATAMHISTYTVQDHLKSIFAKTKVSSRRELIWHFVSRFQLSVEPEISGPGA
ncbi:helix-turn-helix transcriptional regulator [Paenibacillus sp. TSA_86.1]|uniref:helix-turn-helix transcriptional regulator n=1 Tax=Paenibacillus sp. TSA_86.1 TaxID=3415649 RepID=UPI004045B9B2